MKRHLYGTLLLALTIQLSTSAMASPEDPTTGAGLLAPSAASDVDLSRLQDPRIINLGKKHEKELQSHVQAIKNMSATEAESYQHQHRNLKEEQETEMKILLLQIASEQENNDRATELQEALDLLYIPQNIQPASFDDPSQEPESNESLRKNRSLTPDDKGYGEVDS